ncbi:MAG TPA: hypothetical protein PLB52_00380 [Candidatus Moranbacteria bacterium]|nr:hypothetical protein [Candidatus Moranbacteria bacterium]
MGELIQFPVPSGRKAEIKKANQEETRNTSDKKYKLSAEEKAFLDEKCKKYLENKEWVVETLISLRHSSPGAISSENVQKRRALVHDASSIELMDIIIAADETKIKSHPAYYEAVVLELESRGRRKENKEPNEEPNKENVRKIYPVK